MKALARAVYAQRTVTILDDSLKGLDASTASKCFQALFGSGGLLRSGNGAAVMATHTAQWLPFADQIIVLADDGRVAETGTFSELMASGGYVTKLKIRQEQEGSEEDGSSEATEEAKPATRARGSATNQIATQRDEPRQERASGKGSMLHYIRSMGWPSFIIFLILALFQTVCRTMQRRFRLCTIDNYC